MRPIAFFCLMICTTCLLAQSADPAYALQQRYHEFDFWLGKWDVYKNGTDTLVGQSHIESIIDSVAIQENYRSTRGPYQGKSFNKYNPRTNQWEQYWIDNGGLTLHLQGAYSDGKMVLQNEVPTNEGTRRNRITWHDNPEGTVRQVWEISTDKGKTWNVAFDGIYKRKK